MVLSSDQAREKGWLVHRPTEGRVRKTCWPGWKIQGRARRRVTRIASPGRVSTIACVRVRPMLRYTSVKRRIKRSTAQMAIMIFTYRWGGKSSIWSQRAARTRATSAM